MALRRSRDRWRRRQQHACAWRDDERNFDRLADQRAVRNFNTFNKTGTSTWTLQNTSPVSWTVSAGTLSGNGGTSLRGNAAVASGATLNQLNRRPPLPAHGLGRRIVTKDGAATTARATQYLHWFDDGQYGHAGAALQAPYSSSQVNLAAAGTALDISATAAALLQTLTGVAGSNVTSART